MINLLTPWLMEPEVQCLIHKGIPITPILSRINPILVLTPVYFRSILIFSSHLHIGLSRALFPVGLPVKIFKAHLSSCNLAT